MLVVHHRLHLAEKRLADKSRVGGIRVRHLQKIDAADRRPAVTAPPQRRAVVVALDKAPAVHPQPAATVDEVFDVQ